MLNKKVKNSNIEALDGGDYGIQFPWISVLFLIVGLLSEVTDSLLLMDVLSPILSELSATMVYIISFITGAVCFFSMAAIGYQSANTKVSYTTKNIEIAIWLAVGIYLGWLRINYSIFNFEGFANFFSNKDVVMAGLAFLLYVGTGFMTYSSVKQLTNPKLYEYVLAKREYDNLVNEIFEIKEEINEGINDLTIYPNYAKRLEQSKISANSNIQSYNESIKSIVEAKIALKTEPVIMDEIYDQAILKAKKTNLVK